MNPEAEAVQTVRALAAAGARVAVAESLTGGALGAAITSVPGASRVFLGGVIAYATPLKASLLGVSAHLLAEVGPVDGEVAQAMAAGVRRRLGADWGVALTGVAGPDPQSGKPPGTVWVGLSTEAGCSAAMLSLQGTRDQVRSDAVAAALRALRQAVHDGSPASVGSPLRSQPESNLDSPVRPGRSQQEEGAEHVDRP